MNKTKIRILDESLKLFNNHGFLNISQHTISDKLKISPGNLTYHFRKKEDIILELFNNFVNVSQEAIAESKKSKNYSAPEVIQFINSLADITYKYRFISNDLVSLNRGNKSVSKSYKKVVADRDKEIKRLVSNMIKAGALSKTLKGNDLDHTIESTVMVLDTYMAKICANKNPKSTITNDMTSFFFRTFGPYLTAKGKKDLKSVL